VLVSVKLSALSAYNATSLEYERSVVFCLQEYSPTFDSFLYSVTKAAVTVEV